MFLLQATMPGIRLTGYRLTVTIATLSLGIWKAVASNNSRAIVSNTLDWVIGVVLAIGSVG
jgi:hypothetical protein